MVPFKKKQLCWLLVVGVGVELGVKVGVCVIRSQGTAAVASRTASSSARITERPRTHTLPNFTKKSSIREKRRNHGIAITQSH